MGKISPVSIKYVIHAKFVAIGTVEKPDVIGAVFGQTEGLLGSELELRELQKGGKIGRIDVETEINEGKTVGKIEIPTALDKTETTLIAAAIETIERIGPSDAKIEIEDVEDIRGHKREYIVERAKKLLAKMNDSQQESQEITETVTTSSRISKLQEYGTERLPGGNLSGKEIIVVEGRADVLNLLKHGIYNVIGMNGTVLPETVKEMGKEKSLTLFVDGDRGGLLIAKNILNNTKVDFIASAPTGEEVEELSGKEIISSLRKKITTDEFMKKFSRENRGRKYAVKGRISRANAGRSYSMHQRYTEKRDSEEVKKAEMSGEEKETFRSYFYDLIGTRGASIIDTKLNIIKKVPLSEVLFTLKNLREEVYAIIIDGTATSEIIKTAERTACKHIIAKNFASSTTSINLVSL